MAAAGAVIRKEEKRAKKEELRADRAALFFFPVFVGF